MKLVPLGDRVVLKQVEVGAANFANPRAMETIADEMAAWMDKNGVKTLDEIRGCARHAE